jgi:hypothetical protein
MPNTPTDWICKCGYQNAPDSVECGHCKIGRTFEQQGEITPQRYLKHTCKEIRYPDELRIICTKEPIDGYKWKLCLNVEPNDEWINYNINYCPFCGQELTDTIKSVLDTSPATMPAEIEPKYETSDRIKIHTLEKRTGIFVSDKLWNNRQLGYATLITWVSGHGGDVWKAKNDDGTNAVYSTTEFTVVAEPAEITDEMEAELITGDIIPGATIKTKTTIVGTKHPKGDIYDIITDNKDEEKAEDRQIDYTSKNIENIKKLAEELVEELAKKSDEEVMTILSTPPPTESEFRREYQNNPQQEPFTAKEFEKASLKPKGQYLQIMVCPDKLRAMPHPNIGSDTIERVLDRAISGVFEDVFGASVKIRFYWKDRYTKVSPCAKDVRFDDSEFQPIKLKKRTTEEKVDHLIGEFALLKTVVNSIMGDVDRKGD